jgi:CRISPR-associated protein Csm2
MSNGRYQERDGGGGRSARSHSGSEERSFSENDVVKEITSLKTLSTMETDKLVDLAEKMEDFLANRIRLKTSQIRKFLDAVNEIKSKGTQEKEGNFFRSECMLLKPKLAYAAGRQDEVKPLMTVLAPCIDRVHSKNDFDRFYRFVEAIIAYHRYHGGRD